VSPANNPHSHQQSQEIVAYLRGHKRDMVSFLAALVEEESPSLLPEAQEGVLALIANALQRMGYAVQHIPGKASGGHLLAGGDLSDAAPEGQLLLGHSDTVWPLGSLQSMPLKVTRNHIAGPGVYDMKGGLTQIVFALEALAALGLTPALPPRVFINSDEEIGSPESTSHIRRMAASANRVLVLEPALGPRGKLKTARKGVGRFTLEVIGRSAHAGLEPEKGASAILELSYQIQQLFGLNDPQNGVSVNVGMVEGGQRPNVVAANSKAVIDVRVPTTEDARRLEKLILALKPVTPGVALKITGSIDRMPLERTPRNQALWQQARRIGLEMALDLEEGMAGGASDGNTTSHFTATLDGLGPVGDGAHATHEYVVINSLVDRTALLAGLLMAPPVSAEGDGPEAAQS
jgi:glutamate carboxypeptidase